MMWRWLCGLLAWRNVEGGGLSWQYQENAITGARRAFCLVAGGHVPRPQRWLDRREHEPLRPPNMRGGE